MNTEPTDLDPNRSDHSDAATEHLEPLNGVALERELHTLFAADDEADGRSIASPTTGGYVDAGASTITAAGTRSTVAAPSDRNLSVERPAKRTKHRHGGSASSHPRSSDHPIQYPTFVGKYFRFAMLHVKGFAHKVYTGPPDQDHPSKQIERNVLCIDFRANYKVTAVYESESWLSFQFKVKQGNDERKVWTNARKHESWWVRVVRGPIIGDEVSSDDDDI